MRWQLLPHHLEVSLTIGTVGKVLGVFDAFPVMNGEQCHIVRIYFLVSDFSGEVALGSDHDAFKWVDPHTIGDLKLMTEIPEMLEAAKAVL